MHFLGEVDHLKLAELTRGAFAGLAPFQELSPSYRFSLPGKLFEYIQAGIPVLTTDLPEIRKVVDEYKIGICLKDFDSNALVATLLYLDENPELVHGFRQNMPRAQAELCWEVEESRYLSLFPN